MNRQVVHRLFAGLLSVLLVAMAMLPARFQLESPRLGRPAVVLAGASVDLQLNTSIPMWSPDWQVQLLVDGHPQDLPIEAHSVGPLSQRLSVTLPDELAQGRYGLRIHADDESIDYDASVYVRREFPQRMRFVQVADLPTFGVSGNNGDARMAQIIEEINLINPDFVLFTGDVAYVGGWEQYRRLLDAIKTIDAPVIVAPGNHEYEGWGAYLHSFGLPIHAVDVGQYRVINLNSGHARDQVTESQLQWLQDVMRETELAGKIPLVQIHHPIFYRPGLRGFVQGNAQPLVDLFSRYKVPIVVSGHWHGDAVYDSQGQEYETRWQFPGTAYTVVTTAGADLREKYSSSPLHYGYRLVRLDGEKLINYTYDYDGDGQRDAASSIPMNKLQVHELAPDHIQINNALNESLDAAQLRFTLPGRDLQRQPSHGVIRAQHYAHGKSHIALELDVPARSVQDVHLVKPGSE